MTRGDPKNCLPPGSATIPGSGTRCYCAAMSKYAFDPEFDEYIPSLPTVQDFSSAQKIQALREMRD